MGQPHYKLDDIFPASAAAEVAPASTLANPEMLHPARRFAFLSATLCGVWIKFLENSSKNSAVQIDQMRVNDAPMLRRTAGNTAVVRSFTFRRRVRARAGLRVTDSGADCAI